MTERKRIGVLERERLRKQRHRNRGEADPARRDAKRRADALHGLPRKENR